MRLKEKKKSACGRNVIREVHEKVGRNGRYNFFLNISSENKGEKRSFLPYNFCMAAISVD